MLEVNIGGLLKLTEDQLNKNMAKAGVFLVSQYRGFLNTAQSYRREGKRLIGDNPSKPGNFPHKLSGQLQKSITWQVDKKKHTLTVGSNLAGYPKFLEVGTRQMEPRPWLSLGWAKSKDKVGKIITK